MDRLIALLGLRFKLERRALLRARESLVGLALMVPVLLIFAAIGSLATFVALRRLEGAQPEWVLPLVSAAATFAGFFWSLSPLLAGLALTETHDVSRLVHFPVPPRTLVLSSFASNLLQPSMLVLLPVAAAAALALARPLIALPLTAAGVLLSVLTLLAAAQAAGLVLQGLGRNRRWHDLALFLGLGLSFVMSLLPALVMMGSGSFVAPVSRALVRHDLFAVSPFAWGLRAAVHGARGEVGAFTGYAALSAAATVALIALSSALVVRIHRSEVVAAPRSASGRARMRLPGALGALIEKDLRIAWRDPAIRAGFFIGLAGPLVFLFFLSRGRGPWTGTPLLLLATFMGLSPFGANAFGNERRGLSLLMSFPLARWKILAAKNLGVLVLRAPSVLAMLLGGAIVAPPRYLPAVAVAAFVTLLLSAAMDNYLSVLFPMPAPAPGGNPYGAVSGGRGLGAALVGTLLIGVVVALCAPFVFLVWLPLMLASPALWIVTLPLALIGALAVYTMLLLGAERLLVRREPELLERILGEAA